ncbi:uncharacterized protein LOC112342368 [Selaginella moellendorffii]|uniref:uncharacterized protein LOC112342368 n=1 Tax=Selaginella moellendorffii TaxID=88036 RepID=UPI000D1CDA40|nr:uncharacterized protein LOC112342368 [Selaginella moellendorffii]|eukprot:XP_024519820.1 uncharacterized protein LOC112342368 [Selaginella moellendorffii]
MPKPDVEPESAGAENRAQATNQIQCCAFNADGSYFVTGSSDKLARVWDARKWADEYTGRPNHEHPETDGFIADENPTEAVSSDDKQGYIWKKGKAAKRARMPYHSSSSSEEDKLVDVPCDTKKGLEATRVENGDTKVVARAIISESESERSLSADYLDEQQRREQNHTL